MSSPRFDRPLSLPRLSLSLSLSLSFAFALAAPLVTGCAVATVGDDDAAVGASVLRPPSLLFAAKVSASATSIDAYFENGARPVACAKLSFAAPVAPRGACGSAARKQVSIAIGKVTFAPRERKTFQEGGRDGDVPPLGAAELHAIEAQTGKGDLVYCAAPERLTEADCGYGCVHNHEPHDYGDEWGVEAINGTGERKLTCNVFGEPVVKTVCAVVEGQKKRPGDSWTAPIANGALTHTCQPSGAIQVRATCSPGATPSAEGPICVTR